MLFALAIPTAHAGIWAVSYSSPGAGATWAGHTYPYSSGSNGYGGGGPTQCSCSGTITATFTWQAAGQNIIADPPPQNAIVQETSSAGWQVYGTSGSCDDGHKDPVVSMTTPPISGGPPLPFNTATSSGTWYQIKQTNGNPTFTISCSPSASIPNGWASDCAVAFSAVVLAGHWDGPYYFHNGAFVIPSIIPGTYKGVAWPNNTAGYTPNPATDPYDTNSAFSWSESTDSNPINQGTITPFWFWDGPITGQAPPAPLIIVSSTANADDLNGVAGFNSNPTVHDGLGDAVITKTGYSELVEDTKTLTATVVSDTSVPGEGQGWVALGPTLAMLAEIDETASYSYNIYTGVSVSASLAYNQ